MPARTRATVVLPFSLTFGAVSWFGGVLRRVQNGYLYSYAFWMMIGLAALLGWFIHAYK